MRVKPGRSFLSRWLAPMLVVALAAGTSGASCGDDERPTTPARVERPPPTLRLVVLTDIKGYLEPCGCTSRPLGGIDRTAAKVKALRDEGRPMLVVVAGDLFFDGVDHGVAGAETQDLWKAETLVDVLGRVGVDAATPGSLDFSHGVPTFRALAGRAEFPLLAAGLDLAAPEGAEPTEPALGSGVVREVGGVKVGIFGVSEVEGPDGSLPEGVTRTQAVREAAQSAASELRAQGAEVVVGLVRGTRRTARQVAGAAEGVDFVVQAGLDLAEAVPPFEAGGAWILHAGRQGQGLVVVDVFRRGDGDFSDFGDWTRAEQRAHVEERIGDLRARIAEWEEDDSVAEADVERQKRRLAEMERELTELATPRTVEGNAFAAEYVELSPQAPQAPEVTQVMERHFRRVNEHNREVFASLAPPPLPEDQAGFTGSDACRSCHEEEHTWWTGTKHGQAYPTLEERHKQFNLSCVGCHVTGYMDPGGSTVTHLGEGGVLRNVGCESCHGPGSLHVRDPEVDVLLNPPAGVCIECHNPEHSDTFNYTAYRAMMLAPGHGMPSPEEREQR